MDPKWTSNGSQNGPKLVPEGTSESGPKLGPTLGGQKVWFWWQFHHFCKVRPLRKGSLLAPFWEAFGTPSGLERGLEKHLKNRSKNDSILGPLLGLFWGHVGAQIGSIKGHIKPEGSKRPQKGLLKHESIEIYDVLWASLAQNPGISCIWALSWPLRAPRWIDNVSHISAASDWSLKQICGVETRE